MSLSVQAFARALAVVCALAAPAVLLPYSAARAQVVVDFSVDFGPPPLPDYDQPILPGPGYLWIPGYWSWDDSSADYYWVPGYWSQPPEVGLLWTPGYWGYNDGVYGFHDGYWGDTVGYYGGISYGFGYNGVGFFGGRWDHGQYQYNSSVNNVRNVSTTNVYNQTVVHNNTARTSYNGGAGGVKARPTPAQAAMAKQHHIAPTTAQAHHVQEAKALPSAHFSANKGKPAVAAVTKPGELKGEGVVPAKAAGGPAPTAGESKAGESKTGEPKTGEPKTGEPKTGEPKTGEAKTGEPKVKEPKPDLKTGEPKAEPKLATPHADKVKTHPDKAVVHPDKAVVHPDKAVVHPDRVAPRPVVQAPRVAPAVRAAPPAPRAAPPAPRAAPPAPRAAPPAPRAARPAPRAAPPAPHAAPRPACNDPKKCH